MSTRWPGTECRRRWNICIDARLCELAAAPHPKALTGRHHAETFFATDVVGRIESGLPTRIHGHSPDQYAVSGDSTR